MSSAAALATRLRRQAAAHADECDGPALLVRSVGDVDEIVCVACATPLWSGE